MSGRGGRAGKRFYHELACVTDEERLSVAKVCSLHDSTSLCYNLLPGNEAGLANGNLLYRYFSEGTFLNTSKSALSIKVRLKSVLPSYATKDDESEDADVSDDAGEEDADTEDEYDEEIIKIKILAPPLRNSRQVTPERQLKSHAKESVTGMCLD